MKSINLIFIGDDFYLKSGTVMSSVYVEKTWHRFDFGFISHYLSQGYTINIRPATDEEMGQAHRMLVKLQQEHGD